MQPFATIPDEMKRLHQWVNWRHVPEHGSQRKRKLPICPTTKQIAKVNTRSTWSTFDKAFRTWITSRGSIDGFGFVFTNADPFVGVDLDNCLKPETGELTQFAERVLCELDSYTEVSPSGCGVKCIIKSDRELVGRRDNKLGIEIYSSGRFFTITGKCLHCGGQLRNATQELFTLIAECFPEPTPSMHVPVSLVTDYAPDQEVIRRATNAANGQKFQLLWLGDCSQREANASDADLAFCQILAFWCGSNPEQIDRVFRLSGRYREKWDRLTNGTTYGEATIQKAIALQGGRHFRWPSRC